MVVDAVQAVYNLPDIVHTVSTRCNSVYIYKIKQKKLCLPLRMCGVKVGLLHEAGKSR